MSTLYPLLAPSLQAAASKYDPQKEQEAVEWMEAVVGRGSFPRGTFHEALKDGVYLCELINVLQPGTVKKINSGKMAFKMVWYD